MYLKFSFKSSLFGLRCSFIKKYIVIGSHYVALSYQGIDMSNFLFSHTEARRSAPYKIVEVGRDRELSHSLYGVPLRFHFSGHYIAKA